MGREKTEVENPIKNFLLKRRLSGDKVFFYKQFQNGGTIDGLPDIVCSIKGYFVGVETKAPKSGVLSDRQKVIQRNIESSLGEYWVCSSLNDFIRRYTNFYGHAEQKKEELK